jgi:hypothetical protein
MRIKSFLFQCKNRCHLYLFRKRMGKHDILINKNSKGYQFINFQDAVLGGLAFREAAFFQRMCMSEKVLHLGKIILSMGL